MEAPTLGGEPEGNLSPRNGGRGYHRTTHALPLYRREMQVATWTIDHIESYHSAAPIHNLGEVEGTFITVSTLPSTPITITEALPSAGVPDYSNALECLISMRGKLDIWSVIKAMYNHIDTPFQDFLCQELERFPLEEVEFYLPQLCHFLLHRFSITTLQRFILSLCKRSVFMAMRIFFICKAASEDKLPESLARACFILEQIETIIRESTPETHTFWNDQHYMVRTLTQTASTLFSIPVHLQKQVLQLALQQLYARLSAGLFLPVVSAADNYHSILNIISEDAFCLGTRARVPFMMFIETVELGGEFGNLEDALHDLLFEDPLSSSPSGDKEFAGMPLSHARDLLSKNNASSPSPARRRNTPPSNGPSLAKRTTSPRKKPISETDENPFINMEQSPTRPPLPPKVPQKEPRSMRPESHLPQPELPQIPPTAPKEPPIQLLARKLTEETMKRLEKGEIPSARQSQRSTSRLSNASQINPARRSSDIWAAGAMKDNRTSEQLDIYYNLLREVQLLQADEQIGAEVDTPVGDSYYISSVEEFYCDVNRGALKMEPYLKRNRSASLPQNVGRKEGAQTDSPDEGWIFVENPKTEFLTTAYGELWNERKKRIRHISPYSSLPGWDLNSVIVKSEDDLRQEQLAMQLISCFDRIFREAQLPLWLCPYDIVATSSTTGFIQVVHDAVSLHSLKTRFPNTPTLLDYFTCTYGARKSPGFTRAIKNFVQSLAGYSLVCYFLQIKDRHNGNILLDIAGHIIHIDYGFLLTTGPGNWRFETAPFKLTTEYMDLMGGENSSYFHMFRKLLFLGFMAARKHWEQIVLLVEMMMPGPKMACMGTFEETIVPLKDRFKLEMSEKECGEYVLTLIRDSLGSWRTTSYDNYQRWTNGILY